MSKTVRRIAEELGVSKTAIMKQIENLGLRSSLQKIGNQFAIDEAQETLIKQAFLPQSKTIKSKTENQLKTDIVCVLQATINTLQDQLQEKDKQIASLTAALENTTQALNAAQALHAGTMQQQLGPGLDQSQEAEPVFTVAAQEPKTKAVPDEPGPEVNKGRRHWLPWHRKENNT